MEVLLQGFPMIQIDSFTKMTGNEYYVGFKNWGQDFFRLDKYVPYTLMLEGMGQTAEYNISIIFFEGIEPKPRLYLAGINKAEVFRDLASQRCVYYAVKNINEFGGFYISQIEVLEFLDSNMMGDKIASAQIVHSI